MIQCTDNVRAELDAYVLQASGLGNVTVVARSNYDVARGIWGLSRLKASLNMLCVGSGIHIKSAKFGDHPGWKPDNGSLAFQPIKQLLISPP